MTNARNSHIIYAIFADHKCALDVRKYIGKCGMMHTCVHMYYISYIAQCRW